MHFFFRSFNIFNVAITLDTIAPMKSADERDSNRRSVVAITTGQPAVPQPLPPNYFKFLFFKNGPTPASFSFIFGLFKQTLQFLQYVENVHPVYGAGILNS